MSSTQNGEIGETGPRRCALASWGRARLNDVNHRNVVFGMQAVPVWAANRLCVAPLHSPETVTQIVSTP